jgi:hypothetical protein
LPQACRQSAPNVTRTQILKLHVTGHCPPAWRLSIFHLTHSINKC